MHNKGQLVLDATNTVHYAPDIDGNARHLPYILTSGCKDIQARPPSPPTSTM